MAEFGFFDRPGRFTWTPAVAVPIADYTSIADWQDDESALMAAVDQVALDQANEVLSTLSQGPASLRLVDASRGASGPGLVVEFLVSLAEYAAIAGGTAEAVRLGAQAIRRVHQVVSRRAGAATSISLGAAEYLAGADLLDRVDNSQDLRLVGSGPIEYPVDASFTGFEGYFITFEVGSWLHHYQVDGFGRVTYIGPAPKLPAWIVDDPPPPPDD